MNITFDPTVLKIPSDQTWLLEILEASSLAILSGGIFQIRCQTERHLRLLLSDEETVVTLIKGIQQYFRCEILQIQHGAICRDIPIDLFLEMAEASIE